MRGLANAKAIVTEARSWVGTPYRHQASTKGQGCDCLGLVRGIWRNTIGAEPTTAPSYSSDWGEVGDEETILNAAEDYFIPIKLENVMPGHLIVFRWKPMAIAKHLGIVTTDQHFIHAYDRTGVVETTLGPFWRKRIVAAFRFPENIK